MAKHTYFAFNVSRMRKGATYGGLTLRLGEYFNKRQGEVKALATLHLEGNAFLHGAPLAFVQDHQIMYGKEKTTPNIRMYNFQIETKNLKKIVEQLQKEQLKNELLRPPTNVNGASTLQKYQLIIKLKPNYTMVYSEEKGIDLYKIAASDILNMSITNEESEYFVPFDPDAISLPGATYHALTNKVRDKRDTKVIQTPEEVLAFLESRGHTSPPQKPPKNNSKTPSGVFEFDEEIL